MFWQNCCTFGLSLCSTSPLVLTAKEFLQWILGQVFAQKYLDSRNGEEVWYNDSTTCIIIIRIRSPVIFIPKSVSLLRSIFFLATNEKSPSLSITFLSQLSKYTINSSFNHYNDNLQYCQSIIIVTTIIILCFFSTFKRKSVADRYGCLNTFLWRRPAL